MHGSGGLGGWEWIVVRVGEAWEAGRLTPLHYCAGRPAAVVRVLVAQDARTGDIAGVLTVSMPVLRAWWRREAWGPDYSSRPAAHMDTSHAQREPGSDAALSRREAARSLNRDVRVISRVIVAPEWRGLGVAARLVGAYLEAPLTRRTEAVATMGVFCGFFGRAGMRRIAGPDGSGVRASRHELLGARLRAKGVQESDLVTAASRRRVARIGGVEHAARVWARSSAATRRIAERSVEEILARAARDVAARRVAFVHG